MTFLESFCPAALREGRPAYMGIVNLTPDSFSDGGTYNSPEAAVRQAEKLLRGGADLLDLGAESTRPGFSPAAVPEPEEQRRLLPALRAIHAAFPACPISVDTHHAETAAAAIDAGAALINDVSSLEDPEMAPLISRTGAGIILMNGWKEHIGARRRNAAPGRLGAWVGDGLQNFLSTALQAGIRPEKICLDPGFGFGLKHGENAEVLHALPEIEQKLSPYPLLLGPSRKHFLCEQYPGAAGDPDAATALFCREAQSLLRSPVSLLRLHQIPPHP